MAVESQKKSVTFRFYPCEQSSRHRTLVVYEQSFYDPLVRCHFDSLESWNLSCQRESCDHSFCIPQTIENGYSQLDAYERNERKMQKSVDIQQIKKEAASFLRVVANINEIVRVQKLRDAWVDAKENWGVEREERRIAKEERKRAKQAEKIADLYEAGPGDQIVAQVQDEEE